MAANLKFVCALVLCMVATAAIATALTCSDVSSALGPCLGYLKSGGRVPTKCCDGVKSLNNESSTTALRRQACNCIKSLASEISGLNADYAASLPGKCGVKLPYKISMQTNCAGVK